VLEFPLKTATDLTLFCGVFSRSSATIVYMDWQEISGNWVLIPRHPIGIVHFLGALAAAHYRWLLEQLAAQVCRCRHTVCQHAGACCDRPVCFAEL